MGLLFFIVALVAASGGGEAMISGKRIPLPVKRLPPKLDVRPLQPTGNDQWTATSVRNLGCKDFTWGFCVDDVLSTALEAGGAKAVDSITNWILWFTGLKALTSILCMRFTWKLRAYETSMYALMYSIEDPWPDTMESLGPHPGAQVEGYERAWVAEGLLSGDIHVWWLHLPDFNASLVLCETHEIRRALQRDKMNPSQLKAAQCADGSWKLLLRKDAMANFD